VDGISVVIPTRGRGEKLHESVRRFAQQDFEATGIQIIVVDDGSEPPVPDSLGEGLPARVIVIRQEPRGPAAARNRGIAAAGGDLIVFAGDDILVGRDFLGTHWAWHTAHPDPLEGLAGKVVWPPEYLADSYMRWLESSGLQFGFEGLRPGQQLEYYHFYTSNLSVKRQVFEKYRFDEEFPDATHEDSDLGLRLCRDGFRLFYEPLALAEHHHFYTLEASCGHRRRVGRAGYLFQQKHPGEANFKWIRRMPLPVRAMCGSRAFHRLAEFAGQLGDPEPLGMYFYFRNSEAFWQGFHDAAAEDRKRAA
jgi:GT2 family glycosyltransferase